SIRFSNSATSANAYLTSGGADGVLDQRDGTNPQVYRLFRQYTSSTNREALRFDATGTDSYKIGAERGQTSGNTSYPIEFGAFTNSLVFTNAFTIDPVNLRASVGNPTPRK